MTEPVSEINGFFRELCAFDEDVDMPNFLSASAGFHCGIAMALKYPAWAKWVLRTENPEAVAKLNEMADLLLEGIPHDEEPDDVPEVWRQAFQD